MDRFEDLRTFVSVAEHASVSAAARALGRAPSAVSRRLKELEARLGVQLVTRTSRSVVPTGAGERLLERARRLLADLEEAETLADADTRTLSGTLRLCAPLSFGLHHLCPALDAFMHAHPELAVDLDLDDRIVDLVAERRDLALRIGTLADSRLRSRRLARVSHVVAASPAFWSAHGVPGEPEALGALPALCYSNLARPARWDWHGADGRSGAVTVRPRLLSSNGDALVAAGVAGLGALRLPTFIVNAAIERGELVPALLDHDWGEIGLHAVYPDTRFLPARTRAFVDAMVDAFGGTPVWERCLDAQRDRSPSPAPSAPPSSPARPGSPPEASSSAASKQTRASSSRKPAAS